MIERALRLVVLSSLLAGAPILAHAQNAAPVTDSLQNARAEEVLARVRRLTASDVNAARAVVDSLVLAMPAGLPSFPEALFAKASIAPSAVEAERTYGRIVSEHRFSPRVPDALMRLALLESARNNRAGALKHLERLLRDHNDAPVRSRASLLAGRLRLESNDLARACDLLAAAYASAGVNERDVRDQAESLGARCPTSIVVLAAQEPPPLGIARAASSAVAPAAVVPAKRISRRDSLAAERRAAAARRDSVLRAAPATVVVHRDPAPTAKPKPAVPVEPRDSVAAPAPVVVRRDSVAPPKASAPVARRDSVTPPKASAPVTRADSTPAAKAASPVVRRDTTPVAKPAAPVVRRDSTPAPKPVLAARESVTTPPPAPTRRTVDSAGTARPTAGRFSVQFAAYNDRPGAEQYAGVLRGRGIAARVDGMVAPFRVRAGRFTTRAEAEAAMALWKKPGTQAFIVPLGNTP